MAGVRQVPDDLADVTTPDDTAALDSCDHARERASDLLGFRADLAPGLAHRVIYFEYDGDVGGTLPLRLFSPERLGEAAAVTGWAAVELQYDSPDDPSNYDAALEKAWEGRRRPDQDHWRPALHPRAKRVSDSAERLPGDA